MDLKAGLYRHYKGGIYQVLGLAEHSETGEKLVIYVSLAPLPGPRIRARPVVMWNDELQWPDKIIRPRFFYIGTQIDEESDETKPHTPEVRTPGDHIEDPSPDSEK